MAKTNPIGVRFDKDMLDVFKEDGIADSPQKALNFLTNFYIENKDKPDFKKLFSGSKLFKKSEVEISVPGKVDNSKRIGEIEADLKLAPKYLSKQKKTLLELELADLKSKL